jgi:hypothetical protein
VALGLAILFSGAGSIIVHRYEQDQAKGEFSNVSTAGSGRGALWTLILSHWEASGSSRILIGDGLRSAEHVEEANGLRKKGVIAQSDLISALTELGIIGLIAWLLTWLTVLRSRVDWIVLLPLMAFALLNGSLEYIGATVYCIALSAACISEVSTLDSYKIGRVNLNSTQVSSV